MKPELHEALSTCLLSLADDELVLGQRDAEWCGGAPILEEDIAFANIALDEIGHATVWYTLLADLVGEERESFPDRLVFFRQASAYRNIQMVELPKGDWAFTILRQYLFDAAELVRLEALAGSHYQPLAEAAEKIRREEIYHLRHSQAWVRRLGLGTETSRQRLQAALDIAWPYTRQLFASFPGEEEIIAAGYAPASQGLATTWEQKVIPFLAECGLRLPETNSGESLVLSRAQHSPHLITLLAEMQSVARLDAEADW